MFSYTASLELQFYVQLVLCHAFSVKLCLYRKCAHYSVSVYYIA